MGILTDGDPLSKFSFFTIFRIFTSQKGNQGNKIPNPKQKGGEMWTEGGLSTTNPYHDRSGDHDFRTHPAKQTVSIRLWCLRLASSSRLHSIGIRQSKSRSNIATPSAQYKVSIAVTNRVVLWNICRINMSITMFVTIPASYCTFTTDFIRQSHHIRC